MSWVRQKRVIDRDHEHNCVHSKNSDIRTLVVRNGLWTDDEKHCLTYIISKCPHCLTISDPAPARKVLLSPLTTEFNDTVRMDHLYLDEIMLLRVIRTISRYSAVYISENASIKRIYYCI